MSQKGFTLIELMVAVSILAIILTLAVPGFNNLIQSTRAQSQSDSIASALSLARSEAIKRGANLGIGAVTSTDWHSGWRIWVDSNADRVFDSGEEVVRAFPAFTGSNSLTSTISTIGFSAQGLQTGIAIGSTTTLVLRVGSTYCALERDVLVNHLGRVSVQRRDC